MCYNNNYDIIERLSKLENFTEDGSTSYEQRQSVRLLYMNSTSLLPVGSLLLAPDYAAGTTFVQTSGASSNVGNN